ncbi:hypothetical protein HDU96_006090 [Phlyctochytrium bullatum]|nr:hypothetical protein HDU96_006090 [Phlyctochytrium bullatum]
MLSFCKMLFLTMLLVTLLAATTAGAYPQECSLDPAKCVPFQDQEHPGVPFQEDPPSVKRKKPKDEGTKKLTKWQKKKRLGLKDTPSGSTSKKSKKAPPMRAAVRGGHSAGPGIKEKDVAQDQEAFGPKAKANADRTQ